MKSEEKRMIMLKNTGSQFFDEAYFVMSVTAQKCKLTETQLIKEANRIVNESFISGYFCPEKKKSGDVGERARFYLAGFISGIAACMLFVLFFS